MSSRTGRLEANRGRSIPIDGSGRDGSRELPGRYGCTERECYLASHPDVSGALRENVVASANCHRHAWQSSPERDPCRPVLEIMNSLVAVAVTLREHNDAVAASGNLQRPADCRTSLPIHYNMPGALDRRTDQRNSKHFLFRDESDREGQIASGCDDIEKTLVVGDDDCRGRVPPDARPRASLPWRHSCELSDARRTVRYDLPCRHRPGVRPALRESPELPPRTATHINLGTLKRTQSARRLRCCDAPEERLLSRQASRRAIRRTVSPSAGPRRRNRANGWSI